MAALSIQNDGPRIVSTVYWETVLARDGEVFLSFVADTFRLLLPVSLESKLRDMRKASTVIVSYGTWPIARRHIGYEMWFDDGSDHPFALHFGTEQIGQGPHPRNDGRSDLTCTVWTKGPTLALSLPARYRVVPMVPCFAPWGAVPLCEGDEADC